MTQADVYRRRAKVLEKRMKKATRTDAAVMGRKKKALTDMAENEDWREGKPGSQMKTKTQ